MVLLDRTFPDCGLPGKTAKGSRLKFLIETQLAARNHSHFIYDFIGVARAHWPGPWWHRPYLTFIHGIEVWDHPAAKVQRFKAARRASVLLSNSLYTRERANRVYGGFDHAKVCWLATEEDTPPPPRERSSALEQSPRVLIVSRLESDRYKGHAELIACWHKVVSSVPGARLTIVGKGVRLAEIRRQSAASPAADKIELLGFVPDEAMAKIWAETSVFAMPSRGEGFGLVYIEAMRYGIPVIASIHDAAPEINIDGETGYNVDLEKPDELPDRLIALLKDADLRNRMGDAGFRRWSEHFRFSAFRERFLPFLAELLSVSAGSARER